MKLLMHSAPPPSFAAANKMRLSVSSSSSLLRSLVTTVLLLLLVASSLLLDKVQADFGDTVDPTFNCAAYTTCAQVCVATVEDCPPEMSCPDGGNTTALCADGSCAQECSIDAVSPCAYACAPIACNRVDDYFDACVEKYGALYDAETTCGEQEQISETTLLQYTELAYVYGYAWVSIITVLILGWCAYK
jgi:hypothetical protein